MSPLTTVVVAFVVSLSVAGGQDSGAAKSPLPSMSGVVKDVSPATVTLSVGGNDVAFKLDSSTNVIGYSTHKGDLVYRPGQIRTIVDYVKVGDRVTVRYRQFDDMLVAGELRLVRRSTLR